MFALTCNLTTETIHILAAFSSSDCFCCRLTFLQPKVVVWLVTVSPSVISIWGWGLIANSPNTKRSWFLSLSIDFQYTGALSIVWVCSHLCTSYMCLCVLALGDKGSFIHAVQGEEGRVHAEALGRSFSGALSYAQASFWGHMMSSRVWEGDVGNCSNDDAAVCDFQFAGFTYPGNDTLF